mgnify:CR=1 FL=1
MFLAVSNRSAKKCGKVEKPLQPQYLQPPRPCGKKMWKKIGFTRTFFFHIAVFLFPLRMWKNTVNGGC